MNKPVFAKTTTVHELPRWKRNTAKHGEMAMNQVDGPAQCQTFKQPPTAAVFTGSASKPNRTGAVGPQIYLQADPKPDGQRTVQREPNERTVAFRTRKDLPKLPERRFTADQLETEIALCLCRYDQWLTFHTSTFPVESDLIFFLVDLDNSQQLSETYGPVAASGVLQQIRKLLSNVCRESDYLIQQKNNAFLVVARSTNRINAEPLAERIRATIANHDFELDNGIRISRTCSIGFACYPYLPRYPRLLPWSEVVDIAQRGLDLSKQNGRNAWTGFYGTERATPEAVVGSMMFDVATGGEKENGICALTSVATA